jgi:hypothetical protein
MNSGMPAASRAGFVSAKSAIFSPAATIPAKYRSLELPATYACRLESFQHRECRN